MASFSEKHAALKEKIHNTRIPLSKRGLRIAQVVYVLGPVLLGYGIMQGTNWYADRFCKEDIEEKRRRRVGNAFDGSAPIETVATDSTRAAQSVKDLVSFHRTQKAGARPAATSAQSEKDSKKEPHPWARGGSVWDIPTARQPPLAPSATSDPKRD